MPYKTEVGDFENSLASWVSEHLGETSMTDEVNCPPTPPGEKLFEIEIPSSRATELNIMTQNDLDRLWEVCFFPPGVRTRIPGNGEMILSVGVGEVAFYEAAFPIDLRCLYALLKGPRLESGWLYFKARPSKNILKGAPDNVKGWKKKFFFILGDDLEFHLSISREEGAVHVLRLWGAPGKRCNKVPAQSETEDKRFRGGGTIKGNIGGKTEGDIGDGAAEGDIEGEATASIGDTSKSSHSRDVPRPEVSSRDDLVEFIGIIGKEMRKILPHIPDLTLLRWSEGKVRDPIFDLAPNSSSSSFDSRLGSRLDSGLSPELKSDAMSKRIKLSRLAKVVAKKTATSSSKGVVISEGANVASAQPPVPREGSATKSVLGETLGPHASVMASAATAKKIFARVILPADKEKLEKLNFNQVVTKFLHVLGKVLPSPFAVVIFWRVPIIIVPESSEHEIVRAQNRAIELEGALAEASAKEKKVAGEVEAKNKEVAKLEVRVVELKNSQNLAKGRIITAFKESEDFQEAVMGSASSYFGDGFDFCKRQLWHHYPNLGINFDDIEMNQDFLAKEEAEVEKKERKAAEEREEKKAEVEEKN
ncbi:hypothetical protein CEY00_Acc18454 [Actinidia chinensis var. chinensis]|uniref:Uncharacterized protein n=1 Tax=Actinidia chinensis var. chinensis TaxID=1590841 RepID=A0A2R6QHJ7_ACTCC|nr:hypothetical protein CEY00_Acc18454 [Actinidia chinensis var. chinensis]